MDGQGFYDGGSMEAKTTGGGLDSPRHQTVRNQLTAKLARLKEEQKNIEDTIASLDAIPGVEKLLDQLRKVGV